MEMKQELIAVLQAIPWFQELEPDHFDKLMNISHLCNWEANQELFKEGENEDFLYVVIEGRVAIEIAVPTRGKIRVYTAEPMDIVGWSSVTPVVRQRTATARAVLPSRLVCMDAKKLRLLCEEDHDLGYIFMRRMANVVASRLLVTRLQLLDMFATPNPEEVKNA
jgi:CRP/FNR family transcriptional regulator, cyclic AMP receptor protein